MEEYLKKKRLQCNKIGKMRFIRYYMEKPEIKKKRKRERKKKEKKSEEINESLNNIRIQVGESQDNTNEKSEKKTTKVQFMQVEPQIQSQNQNILSSPIPTTPNFAPQHEIAQADNQNSHLTFNSAIIPAQNCK